MSRTSREDVLAARTAAGLTQREMADIAGVTLRSYQRWEAEGATHRHPHPDTWAKVVRKLRRRK